MTDALAYEWRRLTTLRSTWWISTGAVAVAVGLTFLVAMALRFASGDPVDADIGEDESLLVLEMMTTQFSNFDPMFYLVAYVVAILGVLTWGHEYRHGMIRATLTAVPQRGSVWLAKHLLVAAWVSAVVLVTCVLSYLVAAMWFAGLGLDHDLPALAAAVGRRIVYTVLLAWVVMSLTVIVRHQTFALVAMYLWPMAVETVIKGILTIPGLDEHRELARFLPFNAGGRIMQRRPLGSEVLGDPLNAWGGFLVFGAFTVLLLVASWLLFRRRDA